jgi:hypothetical protein
MRYATVKDSLVTNIVEWDGSSDFPVDGELIQADTNAYIGGTYNGSFAARPVEPDTSTYADKRKAEYPSIDELVVALWEGVVEERMASVTQLEALRQAVKLKYPKG